MDVKSRLAVFIFLPSSVEFSVSNDGHNFKLVSDLNNNISEKGTKAFVHSFDFNAENILARFIHIKAKNIGICPKWHKGAGEKAWLFCDEIGVE